MCNPAAIGMVVMAVGAGLQYKANQDRQEDMQKLNRRETERQDKLQKEAEGSLRANQQSYEKSSLEDAMAAAAGEREAQYAAAEASAPRTFDTVPGQNSTSNTVIQDAFSRAFADADSQSAERGRLGAQLASFGDALGIKALENNRRTGDIGMIGSFSRGSANVLPLELQHAMTRTRGAEVAGNLLMAVGGGLATGGAGGALMGGASALGSAGGGAGAGAYSGAAGGLGGMSGYGAPIATYGAGAARRGQQGVDFSRIFGGG